MEAGKPRRRGWFPGNLKIAVRYTLTDDNLFRMDYRVSSDADTIINLTNHSYFNLDGGGNVLGQKLRLYASRYLEGNEGDLPHRAHPAGGCHADGFPGGQSAGPGEIDTGYPRPPWWAAAMTTAMCWTGSAAPARAWQPWASSDKTGISMKLYTSQPGHPAVHRQLLQDCPHSGQNGQKMDKYSGFALEPQHFPQSFPDFPSTVLRAGKVFRSTTSLRFFTGKQCGRL